MTTSMYSRDGFHNETVELLSRRSELVVSGPRPVGARAANPGAGLKDSECSVADNDEQPHFGGGEMVMAHDKSGAGPAIEGVQPCESDGATHDGT